MHANLISKVRQANARNINHSHQPHIRIEIDDIEDVPLIYVDGKRRFDLSVDEALVNLKYEWLSNGANKEPKSLDIKYIDLKSEVEKYRKFGISNIATHAKS